MMDKELYYLIDTDLTLYTIKGKAIKDCFDKCISPLDIVSQVGNETQAELVHELNLKYVKDFLCICVKRITILYVLNDDNSQLIKSWTIPRIKHKRNSSINDTVSC